MVKTGDEPGLREILKEVTEQMETSATEPAPPVEPPPIILDGPLGAPIS